MPIPAIAYAAAYVGGTLAGAALGTTIVQKALPSQPTTYSSSQSRYPFDLQKEMERLGFPTTAFGK